MLVHELYLRLPEVQHLDWQGRTRFLAVGALMLENILVDQARKRRTAKRGGVFIRTHLFKQSVEELLAEPR